MMSDTTAIQFGAAGMLFIGPDAEVRQHCAAIVAIYRRSLRKRGDIARVYADACSDIERRASAAAPIPATTAEGIRAKAEAVLPLAAAGMAGYAYRILAASLARDILAQEGEP